MNYLVSRLLSIARTDTTCVWLETLPSGAEWRAQIHLRAPQGLWYLSMKHHGTRPTSQLLYYNTYCRGLFSARPFLLGSPCDDSTEWCVLALLADFCRERELDTAAIIRHADPARPSYSRRDFAEIRRQADWEGTVFPPRWAVGAVTALCLTLDDPRWGTLAHLIDEVS
jgi:hypothetical protein